MGGSSHLLVWHSQHEGRQRTGGLVIKTPVEEAEWGQGRGTHYKTKGGRIGSIKSSAAHSPTPDRSGDPLCTRMTGHVWMGEKGPTRRFDSSCIYIYICMQSELLDTETQSYTIKRPRS